MALGSAHAGDPVPNGIARPSLPVTRFVLALGTLMAVVAGTQLFVGTEHTDRYFAWTIEPPLTAAFLGANYVTAIVLLALCARERLWERARIGVQGGLVLTTLVLVATLVHLEKFHIHHERFLTRLGAWMFVLTYVLLPAAFLFAIFLQRRVSGGDGERTTALPGWFRLALGVQGVVMLALGVALVLAPTETAELWPWTLTPLTARAAGAWAVALGVAAVLVVRENDLRRVRVVLDSYVLLGVLQLVALARYSGTPDWDDARAWVYVAFVLGIVAVGGYGAWSAHAWASSSVAAAPRSAR